MDANNDGERPTVLRLDGITKRFGGLIANDRISLDLKQGEVLGLLGENGAGKTTLMNILFGHYVADEGRILVNGEPLAAGDPKAALAAGIGMVHQHFTLADNLTVLDNVLLGTESLWRLTTSRATARQKIANLSSVYGLHVSPDAVVSSLSVGERQRVEIIKALYRNARILILDEPTAVLTPQESDNLFHSLKKFVAEGLSIILISHKLSEILSACDRVLILRSGHRVAELDVKSTSRKELAELMVGREVSSPKVPPKEPGAAVLELHNVSLGRQSQRLDQVSLKIRAGEIIGIAGVSGNGQSLLADLLNGLAQPDKGEVKVSGKIAISGAKGAIRARIGRIPEDRHSEGLVGDLSVAQNIISETYNDPQISKAGFINWKRARTLAETIVVDYQVKCPNVNTRVRLLSGGNMQKLILGRVLSRHPIAIVANQPTRGLDVGAVSYVHEQLLAARERGAGILLISEDLDELLALSDRVSVMFRGKLSPAIDRPKVNRNEIGLMMAGHGLAADGESHAA